MAGGALDVFVCMCVRVCVKVSVRVRVFKELRKSERSVHKSMQYVLVKCEVSVCASKGLDSQDAVSPQCVNVDGWAHCGQPCLRLEPLS